jgi:carboxymethylenebutenolidase
MVEEIVATPTPDGVADGLLFRPDDRRYPGVIFLTDVGGIREASLAMARRVADLGYAVMVPNAFYRTGRPPLFDFVREPGDARTMARFGELAAPLTPEAMARDGAAYVDFLSAHLWVKGGPIGVVGYCFTGALALRTAATRPDRVGAAASFHGGGLANNTPLSPHLVLPRVKGRLYFGHAENDRAMPRKAIDTLERELEHWGGKYESDVYAGAAHSWTVPDSPVYNEPQAERAFEKLKGLLEETIA